MIQDPNIFEQKVKEWIDTTEGGRKAQQNMEIGFLSKDSQQIKFIKV